LMLSIYVPKFCTIPGKKCLKPLSGISSTLMQQALDMNVNEWAKH